MRDESAKCVSQSCKVHEPLKELNAPVHFAEPEAAKADQDTAMVNRRKMTVKRFLPGT